jgi:hypothetical protein
MKQIEKTSGHLTSSYCICEGGGCDVFQVVVNILNCIDFLNRLAEFTNENYYLTSTQWLVNKRGR